MRPEVAGEALLGAPNFAVVLGVGISARSFKALIASSILVDGTKFWGEGMNLAVIVALMIGVQAPHSMTNAQLDADLTKVMHDVQNAPGRPTVPDTLLDETLEILNVRLTAEQRSNISAVEYDQLATFVRKLKDASQPFTADDKDLFIGILKHYKRLLENPTAAN